MQVTAADDYIRRVEEELSDLPWSQRRDLAADLRRHLAELPAGASLYSQLGTPEKYASDLRLAAGLEYRRGPIAHIRSFRPRNLIAAAVVVTALALAITGLVWVTGYQPLAFGGSSVYPTGAKLMRGAAQSNVPFRQGAPFKVGMSIVNNGRFTARVLGISGVPPFAYLPLSHRRLLMTGPLPKSETGWITPHRTFRPVDLPPGHMIFLQLNGTYKAPCHPAAKDSQEFQVLGGFQVRYSALWRTATVRIDLPDNLSIDFPKNEECLDMPPS